MQTEIRRSCPGAPWTYALLDQRQRAIAQELRSRPGQCGALLLSEVAPVVTVGRRTPASDLLLSETELASRGIAVERVDRGGLATYHGPGQWVLFPVERLERLTGDRRGVRKMVEGLLEVMLEVARRYEPGVEIRLGAETGVWSRRGKLGAVGIHIEKGILLHGLALNVFRTPQSFAGIRPCGLEPRVDFLLGNDLALGRTDAAAAHEREFVAVGEQLVSAVFRALFEDFPKLDLPDTGGYTRISHPTM